MLGFDGQRRQRSRVNKRAFLVKTYAVSVSCYLSLSITPVIKAVGHGDRWVMYFFLPPQG